MKVLVGEILKKNLGIVMCVKNAFVNFATDVKNIVFVSERNNIGMVFQYYSNLSLHSEQ